MGRKDLGLGIGTVIMGFATMCYFFSIPRNSSFFPKMISMAIIVLGILIAYNAVRNVKVEPKEQKVSYKRVGCVTVCLFIYYLAFQKIGYTIPTFFLIVATSSALGYRKWKVLIPTALAVSIGLYVVFSQVFHVRFPGVFF